MVSVLFVCVGNICRSPAAQALLENFAKQDGTDIYVASRATGSYNLGQPIDARMKSALNKRSIDISHTAKLMEARDFDEFDYILASDGGVMIDLQNICPKKPLLKKVHKMTDFSSGFRGQDIPDPYVGSDGMFDRVLDMLEDACLGLLQKISKEK